MAIQETSAKPLVFFSASNEDYYWRDQVKEHLDHPDIQLEWWDDSKIEPSQGFQETIDEVIRRATVAAVLLSPAYVASETTRNELNSLLEQNAVKGLRLFPILVSNCGWQSLPIGKFQIWGVKRPLETLGKNGVRDGLLDIASKLRNLALEAVTSGTEIANPESLPLLRFSDGARLVMEKARALATASQRESITSSCLLFAFAESAGDREDTADFVRSYLDQNGDYKDALEKFRRDATWDQPAQNFGSHGKLSTNVQEILIVAHGYVMRTTPGNPPEIHQRHLFAALLTVGESGNAVALYRITKLKLNIQQFRQRLRSFIATSAPRDIQNEWDSILMPRSNLLGPVVKLKPSPRAYTSYEDGPAGYSPEFCGVGGSGAVPDHLEVEEYAKRLAELIALRETKLPLAIGIFGHWGSGKSHFMNLMDRHIQRLAKCARPIAPEQHSDEKWCRGIVPVYFNAWHYLDTNLWASLVAQIFETLFEHLAGTSDPVHRRKKIETLMDELRSANGAAATVSEKLEETRAEKMRAEAEKGKAESRAKELENKRQTVNKVIEGIRATLNEHLPAEISNEARNAMDVLKVKDLQENLSALTGQLREFHTLYGRVQAAVRAVLAPKGRWARIAWLGGAIIGAPLLAWFITWGLASWHLEIPRAGAVALQISAFLGSIAAWVKPQIERGRALVNQVEEFAKKAEEHRKSEEQTKSLELQQKEQELRKIEQEEKEAEAQVAEFRAKVRQIEVKLRELDPERRLVSFIQERAGASDYRSQLGLVSLVRRDFEELSRRFVDRQDVPPADTVGENQERCDAVIDRIVLFVDDLDRCEAERVVVVLQAVHLLLAFPLFAVVVGVDQRCLRESIAEKFKGLISKDASRDGEPPATPLDYLEKIFHVPFHLPQMTEKGFGTLIKELCKPTGESHESGSQHGPKADSNAPQSKQVRNISAPAVGEAISPSPSHDGPGDGKNVPKTDDPIGELKSSQASENANAARQGSVRLYEWELNALEQCHHLIRTPRGAKRLLNTYRLVRAGIKKDDDWKDFRGNEVTQGEFRIAMLLLAAAAGHPANAREWFNRLRSNGQSPQKKGSKEPGWETFYELYNAITKNAESPLDATRLGDWLDKVERFAF